ncbi:glutathione S-transferase N-terminal domain-containing protein [Phyllobacterium sp. SB3]|uniref:glutathione S-transferase N-terminal domain-containing protein n=1 Tax=Phyllobacterium sp. SB3 TaxID=3156073 RepID=UPI0032AEC6B6
MQLFYSPTSPYARKVLVVAIETGLVSRIELVEAKPQPVQRDQNVVRKNPLGKVPTLVTDDGTAIFDSRVICEFLNDQSDAVQLFPPAGQPRWDALSRQSLADGFLDAALLVRYET